METIGKFRTNFLGKGKSFKVGFNNRSPFSYITSSGPELPSRYDGGVPLVNFTPDQYATAYDTTEAVKAEGEMYTKAGEAAGKAVSGIAGTIAGGDASTESIFGDDFAQKMKADDKPEEISRSEMTLDNADSGMLKMFSDWRNSSSFNTNKSWEDFLGSLST
jgi:hypothetical protein